MAGRPQTARRAVPERRHRVHAAHGCDNTFGGESRSVLWRREYALRAADGLPRSPLCVSRPTL
eukprot:1095471-Prymnesium_polylepis.1